VTKSFGDHVLDMKIFVACGAKLPKILYMSRQNWEVAETTFSSGASRVTAPNELIEMVQYLTTAVTYFNTKSRS
jgi:hypothetical protein